MLEPPSKEYEKNNGGILNFYFSGNKSQTIQSKFPMLGKREKFEGILSSYKEYQTYIVINTYINKHIYY